MHVLKRTAKISQNTSNNLIMGVKKNVFVTIVLLSLQDTSWGLASKINENALEATTEQMGPSYDNECVDAPGRLSQELSSTIMSRNGVRIQRIFR